MAREVPMIGKQDRVWPCYADTHKMEGAGDTMSKCLLPDIAFPASLFINLLLIQNIELKIRALGGSAQFQVRLSPLITRSWLQVRKHLKTFSASLVALEALHTRLTPQAYRLLAI